MHLVSKQSLKIYDSMCFISLLNYKFNALLSTPAKIVFSTKDCRKRAKIQTLFLVNLIDKDT